MPDRKPLIVYQLTNQRSSLQVEVDLQPSASGDSSEGAEIEDMDSDVDCMEGLDGEVKQKMLRIEQMNPIRSSTIGVNMSCYSMSHVTLYYNITV